MRFSRLNPMVRTAMMVTSLWCSAAFGGDGGGASTLENVTLNGLNNDSRDFTDPRAMTPSMWSDTREVRRTWDAAIVFMPTAERRVLKSHIRSLERAGTGMAPKKYPLVIYLHGCDGLGEWSLKNMDRFASRGYAVIAPASMARRNYPISCDPETRRGGFYDAHVRMRVADAEYAIQRAAGLSWVDANNVFLIGFSQGATTAAQVRTHRGTGLNARVIIANTCTNRWPGQGYHNGVKAPESEPVLALLGKRDPWFIGNKWARGNCSGSLSTTNGSRSRVYTAGRIARRHDLLNFSEARQDVFEFLAAHRR